MKQEEGLSEIVILIDVTFLNTVVADIKNNFESILQRPLRNIDISDLLVYLALDAGIRGENKSIQVVFVYDNLNKSLLYSYPSDLESELNSVAFTDKLGEFILNSYEPKLSFTRSDLYLEFLKVFMDAEEVKKCILISSDEEYGNDLFNILSNFKNKDIVQFRVSEPEKKLPYNWEVLAYPIMQALGIKGNELN